MANQFPGELLLALPGSSTALINIVSLSTGPVVGKVYDLEIKCAHLYANSDPCTVVDFAIFGTEFLPTISTKAAPQSTARWWRV